MLDTEPLVDERQAKDIVLVKTPELVVEDISFAYPSTGIPVLAGCSLTVHPGEKVALVGRNGSGKTTLLRLIAKVYVPTQGSIWIDGHELRTIRQQSWLNHVLMATQELELPGMEAARALTGLVAEAIDKDRMGLALVFSGADDVVTALPEGMRTWIGEQWPAGRGFSTGQLQRLALAGAFYRFLDPRGFHRHLRRADGELRRRDADAILPVDQQGARVQRQDRADEPARPALPAALRPRAVAGRR